MATKNQLDSFYETLKDYRTKYLKKKYSDLDESATRLMVNSFFTKVLGYEELEDIKTEYRIRGEYADYVIQMNRKKRMVVEVKAIQLELDEKHLRQSLSYAANEGIDWIMLMNGKNIELYRVIFSKPIDTSLVLTVDLSDLKQVKDSLDVLFLLTKKSMVKDQLEIHWQKFNALNLANLMKYIYSQDTIKVLRKLLKKDVGFSFEDEDLLNALHSLITEPNTFNRPKKAYEFK